MVSSSQTKGQQKSQMKKRFFHSWPIWVKIACIVVGIYILFVIIGTIIASVSTAFNSWLKTVGKDAGKLATSAGWAFLFYCVAAWAVPALGAGSSELWKKYQLYNQNKTAKEAAEALNCTEDDFKNAFKEYKEKYGKEPNSKQLQNYMIQEKMKPAMNEQQAEKEKNAQNQNERNEIENETTEMNEAANNDSENLDNEGGELPTEGE